MGERYDEILEFWFGPLQDEATLDTSRMQMWFQGGPELDQRIRERFGALHDEAARGEHDAWAATPFGRLGLVVVLDQFSRHLHRDSGQAFEQDPKALQLVLEGLDLGHDRLVWPIHRAFFYLPLEHSEDPEMQALSVALYEQLAQDAPASLSELFAGFLDYARRHKVVVDRFGRFPHRNAALGRASTAEEEAFLASPQAPF